MKLILSASSTLRTVLLASAMCASAVSAQVVIDDFQSFTDNENIAGKSFWSAGQANTTTIKARTDPSNSSNITLAGVGNSVGVYKNASILDGQSLTLRFNFRLQSSSNDVTLGMTATASPNLGTLPVSNGPSVRVIGSNLNVFDNSSTTPTNGTLALGVWYTLDMVINNDAQTFSAILDGGLYDNTLLVGNAKTNFGFRDFTPPKNLVNFALRSNADNTTSISNALLVDNVQIIPEPSVALLLVTGLTALALTRKRRKAELTSLG